MRQNIKSKEYFVNYIEVDKRLLENGFLKLKNNIVNPEMIHWYKKSLFDKYLYLTIAKYTSDFDLQAIKHNLFLAINYIEESWLPNIIKVDYKNKLLDQYTLSAYDQMLWMLSLGYLLDIANEDFQKLVDVVDRDGVKDFLFEFIIRAKFQDRQPITEESYQKYFGIPKTFEKLRLAIVEKDKAKAESLVKEFITKEWYRGHKDSGWYNSHKSPHDAYFGYWSFETAAVVKIMGLDDSRFRDCQYYPRDLV